MGDESVSEQYRDMREAANYTKRQRRDLATLQYAEARDLAAGSAIRLLRRSESQYSLLHPDGWAVEVYPGNLRIWRHPHRLCDAPYLELQSEWGLLDVVRAAIG